MLAKHFGGGKVWLILQLATSQLSTNLLWIILRENAKWREILIVKISYLVENTFFIPVDKQREILVCNSSNSGCQMIKFDKKKLSMTFEFSFSFICFWFTTQSVKK